MRGSNRSDGHPLFISGYRAPFCLLCGPTLPLENSLTSLFFQQRDETGVGSSCSEFLDYLIASLSSEDVRLVFGGTINRFRPALLINLYLEYFIFYLRIQSIPRFI